MVEERKAEEKSELAEEVDTYSQREKDLCKYKQQLFRRFVQSTEWKQRKNNLFLSSFGFNWTSKNINSYHIKL